MARGFCPVPADASQLPTGASLLGAHSTGVSPVASSFKSARSYCSCTPTTLASTSRPSASLHVGVLPLTSLYFVNTQPSAPTTVPRAVSLPSQTTLTVLCRALPATSPQ